MEYLNSFTTLNDAINSIRETINNLQYSPHNKADKFEEAVKELGLVLGYSSTRPEKDKKEGPDNLWIMDNNQCLVIEAKSEKKSSNLISKEDVSQLYHSLSWFDEKYIYKDANIYGITMQYNSKKERSVTANERLKVIDNESLDSIKTSLNKLIDYLSRKKDIKNINLKDLNIEFKNCNLLTNELGRYLKVIK